MCKHYTLDCEQEERGCKGCAYCEKSADEMFEELGYEKLDKRLLKNIIFTDGNKKIYFHKVHEKIKCVEYDKEEKNFIEGYFTTEELKAINKKVEELGWN